MQDDTQAPDEGKPDDAPTPPVEARDEASEKPGYFDEKFDPASLPDELQVGYKQMRDSFSRKTQTLAEERQQLREAQEVYEALQDPDRQADALRRLGLEFEEPEDEYEEDGYEDDPYESLRREVDQLKAERQQEMSVAQEAELEEAEVDFINQGLEQLSSRTGRDDFSQEEIQALGDLSRVRRTPEGLPDVEGAYELLYTGVLPQERKRWVDSKNSPQAPSGSSAVEVPNLDNERDRQEYLANRLNELDEANPGN